ncbi:MAG TPA: hypothetical protein VGF12_07085 [Roseateles sp.]|uniref:hypothetical protein n=1 Tax=Roseateles sp. TaxID=1971397 RepID=UPI002ED900A0
MKPMRSFAFALLAVAAAAITVVQTVWDRTAEKVASGVQSLKAWAFEGVSLFAKPAEPDAEAVPMVQRVRQVAYRLRLIKREQPIVTPRWRACPSV